MSLSHMINPFNYTNAPHVEVVVLECTNCPRRVKKRLSHSTSDTEIMTRHFPGWKARGYRNQKRTLCPDCANAESAMALAESFEREHHS